MSPLEAAFDPERFRRDGHAVVDLLAGLLADAQARRGAVLPPVDPAGELAHWRRRMAEPPGALVDFLREFAARSIQLHHPRYVGHQVCAPAPAAALAGLASELLNNAMGVYEMGPAANALERWVVEATAGLLGWPAGAGFLTSGGTLANLTALLAARNRRLGPGALERGTAPDWAVLASEESHYCTARAVQVMGGGREGLVTVPTDDRFKLRPELLPAALAEAHRRGRRPFAVVASACSTSTGSYDDIGAIADFCATHGLWLHVDGAHGAAAAFCPELRDRLAGIERADSAVVDFHKLLLNPALATAVLFRQPGDAWAAFNQEAQYLFDPSAEEPWWDSGRRTFECTKLSLSLRIAALWRGGDPSLYAEHVRRAHRLARDFAALVRERPGFEVAVEPESNIVCFRRTLPGAAPAAIDALNERARARILADGSHYLVQTTLRGRRWLRTALMNPRTTLGDLSALLDAVDREPAA